MSTHTPTGDGVATGDGVSAVPPWLPGEAALTRLANDLFAALPGDRAATVLPGDLPAPALGDFVHRRHVICGIDAPRCCRRSALDLDLRITLAYESKPDSLPSR